MEELLSTFEVPYSILFLLQSLFCLISTFYAEFLTHQIATRK